MMVKTYSWKLYTLVQYGELVGDWYSLDGETLYDVTDGIDKLTLSNERGFSLFEYGADIDLDAPLAWQDQNGNWEYTSDYKYDEGC